MPDAPQELDRFSPDKLVVGFSRTKIATCILLAVGVHLLLIAATSFGYIRDRWIDPEGAAQRKAAQVATRRAEADRVAAAERAAAEAAARAAGKMDARPSTGERAAKPGTQAPAAKGSEAVRKEAPVVKEITKMPEKGEIPKSPDGLGISIDETNQ